MTVTNLSLAAQLAAGPAPTDEPLNEDNNSDNAVSRFEDDTGNEEESSLELTGSMMRHL